MKVQSKSNATRSAKSATERTGIEHTISQLGGGWVVVAPAAEKIAGLQADVEQAEDAILGRNAARVTAQRDFAEEYIQNVADILLNSYECPSAILDDSEVQKMVSDGFANGRRAACVAADILAWAAEADDADQADDEDTSADEELIAAASLTYAPAAHAPVTAERASALVWVLVGEHHDVPGTRIEAYASQRVAEDAADNMVRAMLVEAGIDAALLQTDGRDAALKHLNDRAGAAHASVIVQRCAIVAGAPRKAKSCGAAPRKAARADRAESKQDLVLRMLRHNEGASGVAIAVATGWAAHTVRGFLAGLKKKNIDVQSISRHGREVLEDGTVVAAYTVYQVADPA